MTTLSQSPAQEIRAAAEAVRNTAKGATPLMQPAIAEPMAAWLDRAVQQLDAGTVLDTPDCPSCGEGCGGHDEALFHDGDENRAGCERPIAADGGYRCDCFDEALALARAIRAVVDA